MTSRGEPWHATIVHGLYLCGNYSGGISVPDTAPGKGLIRRLVETGSFPALRRRVQLLLIPMAELAVQRVEVEARLGAGGRECDGDDIGLGHGDGLGVAALTPGPEDRPEALIEAADAALYRAKTEGRNRVCAGAPSG